MFFTAFRYERIARYVTPTPITQNKIPKRPAPDAGHTFLLVTLGAAIIRIGNMKEFCSGSAEKARLRRSTKGMLI